MRETTPRRIEGVSAPAYEKKKVLPFVSLRKLCVRSLEGSNSFHMLAG